MNGTTDSNTDKHIDKHALYDAPRFAQDRRQTMDKGHLLRVPGFSLRNGILLNLLHPIAQIPFQLHLAEHEAAYHAEQHSTDNINKSDAKSERAEEHRHSHFIHKRRSDQESEGHSQRYSSFHEAEEERNGGTGTERSDRSEKRCKEILQAIEFMGLQIITQTINRKIGIDDAHHRTDQKK